MVFFKPNSTRFLACPCTEKKNVLPPPDTETFTGRIWLFSCKSACTPWIRLSKHQLRAPWTRQMRRLVFFERCESLGFLLQGWNFGLRDQMKCCIIGLWACKSGRVSLLELTEVEYRWRWTTDGIFKNFKRACVEQNKETLSCSYECPSLVAWWRVIEKIWRIYVYPFLCATAVRQHDYYSQHPLEIF